MLTTLTHDHLQQTRSQRKPLGQSPRFLVLTILAMYVVLPVGCVQESKAGLDQLRRAAQSNTFMPAPEELTELQTPTESDGWSAAMGAALRAGEPGAWVSRAWLAWPHLLLPAISQYRLLHAELPASPEDIAPYLFVWPADGKASAIPAPWVEDASDLTELSPVNWQPGVESGLSVAYSFGENSMLRWTAPEQGWAEGQNPYPGNFSQDVIWYSTTAVPTLLPFENFEDDYVTSDPVTEPFSAQELEDLATDSGAEFLAWSILNEYQQRCGVPNHARQTAVAWTMRELFQQSAAALGRLPEDLDEMLWSTGSVLVNLEPEDEPEDAVIECWSDGVQILRYRVVFEEGMEEDTSVFFTMLNSESFDAYIVPTELLADYGLVPEEWQLLGRWALADTGNLWVPEPPAG